MKTRMEWKCDACLLTTCSFIVMTSEEISSDTPHQCPYCADDIVDFKKVSECEVPEEEDATGTNVCGKED